MSSGTFPGPFQGTSPQLSAAGAAFADALWPVEGRNARLLRDAALVIGFALFTALLAQVKIPLGFTPVPITGQTLAVLLTGAALGSRKGAAALAVYALSGAWLPFYAGDFAEFTWTMQPRLVWDLASGGYIIGFIPAAFAVGWMCERGWDRKPWVLVAMLAGNVILYVPGLIQLSLFVQGIDPSVADEDVWATTLEWGLYPFILGDLIKLYLASLALPSAWWIYWRMQGR